MDGIEKRLDRLEEQAYFQERLARELNEALRMQQKQLDDLEAAVSSLTRRVEGMMELLAEMRAGRGGHERPPHYGPETA